MKKGFTLIELLVVIAIIGILGSLILGALGSARKNARDARRRSDISTIQESLEIYYLDNNQYPISSGRGGAGVGAALWSGSAYPSWESLETELGVDLPEDPINEAEEDGSSSILSSSYSYFSYPNDYRDCPSGSWYILTYRTEVGNANADGEQSGIELCDGSVIDYESHNLITVGISPENAIVNN